jgi:two-component system sensor histidine kinase QseC
MSRSIGRRLLLYLFGLLLLAWLLIASASYLSARTEIQELLDAHLAQSARVLSTLITHEMAEIGTAREASQSILLDMQEPGHLYESKLAFEVHDLQGVSLFRTANFPRLQPVLSPGFFDHTIGERRWRLYYNVIERAGFGVTVAQDYHIRDEMLRDIMLQMLWPLLLVLPALFVFSWLAASHGLGPLKLLVRQVEARNPSNLEPISLHDVPAEIRPVISSLNDLLARLAKALDNERRFTSDAAHELRTPLAGIKAQAQVALRTREPADKDAALQQLVVGIDRMVHLVRQMLMLARLDPDVSRRRFVPLDLAGILQDVAADLAPRAIEKQIDLSIGPCDASCRVLGQQEAVSVLIRNLLDNAIRYTPQQGWVRVELEDTERGPLLRITDSGPGIAQQHQDRIFDRFYRGLGTGQTGSGLGLSIVQRVARLHGARLHFETGRGHGRGVLAEVSFPALE